MSNDLIEGSVESLTRKPTSRRGLLRGAGILAAAGTAAWATRSAVTPLAAQAASGRQVVWSKDAIRVYLVDAGKVVRTMPCIQNTAKTPNGTYSIWSYSRAYSYVDGRKVWLDNFAPFYRRPGATENIGFHAIPVWADGANAGSQIHGDDLLGTSHIQSAGCVRLSAADAAYLRSWAPVGTTVVVQNPAYTASSGSSSTGSSSPSAGAPPFPTGIGPNRNSPSAIPLQRQLKKAGFMPGNVVENANYGPATQKAVAAFHGTNTQFRTSSYDIAIGPKGWNFLFTHY